MRFEDLAFNPKVKIEKIFHYLKIPMDSNVMEYLKSHSFFRGISNVNINFKKLESLDLFLKSKL